MQADGLHILQVSPSDEGGGAEKVAAELHVAYLQRGLDSRLALGADHGLLPATVQIPNFDARSPWARAVLRAGGLADPSHLPTSSANVQRAWRALAAPKTYARVASGLENFDSPGTYHLLDFAPSQSTVLHLHNLHGSYFDIRALPRLAAIVPTIATMHDTWLLTGHCAHPFDCDHWRSGCGDCPYLDTYVPLPRDRSAENCNIKRMALAGGLVHLATPSSWLMRMVEESGVADLVAETRIIPNGVDPSVFHPGDRSAARQALGLPIDALIILFAARSAKSSPFKGFDTLEAALPLVARGASDRKVLMLALGQDGPDTEVGGVPIRSVPFVADPTTVAQYYRASDIYLHPSRAESFGLAVAEAMACGVPVVASDVGGIPEIVTDRENGLLVPVGDAEALAAAALSLLADDDTRDRIARAGAERIARDFTFERQVESYLDWYAEIAESS
jgi:glycosyltransferase involved in cell wall biosynthesis